MHFCDPESELPPTEIWRSGGSKRREMDVCHPWGRRCTGAVPSRSVGINEKSLLEWRRSISRLHRPENRTLFIPPVWRSVGTTFLFVDGITKEERTAEFARLSVGLWNPWDSICWGIRFKRPRHSLDTRPEPRPRALLECEMSRHTTGN